MPRVTDYPPGYVSVTEVAARLGHDPQTIKAYFRRDPTWAGGCLRLGPLGVHAVPDLTTYPPAPPRRRKRSTLHGRRVPPPVSGPTTTAPAELRRLAWLVAKIREEGVL